ncbi:hypothetical protein, partial [Streptomyces lavendulae]|uniref:hypothetical protein n=1 Tax=Streptomyces lavendulae TaxID=1914 RepID=UPI0033D4BD70
MIGAVWTAPCRKRDETRVTPGGPGARKRRRPPPSLALRPTASRENLYDDETLAAVREALGARVRTWL